jgi:hypothetical protein
MRKPKFMKQEIDFRIVAKYTAKHIRPCIYTPSEPEAIIEMSDVIVN